MKRLPLILLLAFVLAQPHRGGIAYASDPSARPFWTEQAMFRFGDELFFTGSGSCAASPEEGRQRAYEAAVREMQNFTHTAELGGMALETQMIFEEPDPPNCPDHTITVWRLLRGDAKRLHAIARHGGMPSQPDAPATERKGPLDLTPKVGMTKDEVFNTFGQPKTITMKRGTNDVLWEYPAIRLKFLFDQDGALKTWGMGRARGGGNEPALVVPGPRARLPVQPTGTGEGSVDLTEKLQKLQTEKPQDELKDRAERTCDGRWPGDAAMQRRCTDYEYELLHKRQRLNEDALARQLDLIPSRCKMRWPRNEAQQLACEENERDRLQRAFAGRQ
jgi:hypothetical protein